VFGCGEESFGVVWCRLMGELKWPGWEGENQTARGDYWNTYSRAFWISKNLPLYTKP
jgi:hypothetical protein